jgi:Bacterial Ig-like domain
MKYLYVFLKFLIGLFAIALITFTLGCGGGGTQDLAPILGSPLASVTSPPVVTATVPVITPTVPVITPTVTATNPPDGTLTCVNDLSIVTATFSIPMDASTINTATFGVSDSSVAVLGNVAYEAATQTASFKPATAVFTPDRVYVATIRSGSAGVKSSDGVAMESDRVWSFRTCPIIIP